MKLKSQTRKLQVGQVTLRTSDCRIDLETEWMYRRNMIELATEHGVQFIDLRSDSFRAFAKTISITVNPVTTVNRLHTFAHECAHIGFKHHKGFTRRRMEYEAETYSVAYLKSQGIDFDEKLETDGRRYVTEIIEMAIRRGVKRFDKESYEFTDLMLLGRGYRRTFHNFNPELIDGSKDNGYHQSMESLRRRVAVSNSQ